MSSFTHFKYHKNTTEVKNITFMHKRYAVLVFGSKTNFIHWNIEKNYNFCPTSAINQQKKFFGGNFTNPLNGYRRQIVI